jgi:GNAT superfamily N-acetyltransferase
MQYQTGTARTVMMEESFLKNESRTDHNSALTISKNLQIRHATHSDKKHIISFCKNTFSWGDYIESAWDKWIKSGNLFVIGGEFPVAICHVFFSKTTLWIEGIRVHNSFRRLGLASKLISHAESLCDKNIKDTSLLVNSENLPCLKMVQKLGYAKKDSWYFYSLLSKNTGQNYVQCLKESCAIPFDAFVDSWRWLLIKDYSDELLEKKQIIYSDMGGKTAYAVIRKNDYFENTISATIHVGSAANNTQLISFLQEFGYKNNLSVQIIASGGIGECDNLKFITRDYYFLKKQRF